MSRFTLVCISLRGGGTERIVCRIANYLVRNHDVSILTVAAADCFFDLDPRVSIHAPSDVRRHSKVIRVAFQCAYLFQVMRELKPDACLVFGEEIAAAGVSFARLVGVPRVYAFLRGTPLRSLRGSQGFINPIALRFAKQVLVQTEAAKRQLGRRYNADRLLVWPNPIDVPNDVIPMHARENLIVNIGFIGRLKNQESLIRIFSKVRRQGWHLAFVGDGPGRPALERMTYELGLRDSVSFEGECREVGSYLNRAAVFAFTSLSEGFPNALAEALASGCACISYDCPTGPSELIQDGLNGYLIPLNDETRFAARLQDMIDDTKLRERLVRRARESIRAFESHILLESLELELRNEASNSG